MSINNTNKVPSATTSSVPKMPTPKDPVKFKGSVDIEGITITWSTNKRMVQDQSGDWDLVGSDTITIATNAPVTASQMRQAMSRVDVLEKARACSARLDCPHTDAYLSVTGLDDTGHLLVQVIRDGIPRGHGPAWDFANLRPEDYSNSGEVAMKSIAFVRDASRIIGRSEGLTVAQLDEKLLALDSKDDSEIKPDTAAALPAPSVAAGHVK